MSIVIDVREREFTENAAVRLRWKRGKSAASGSASSSLGQAGEDIYIVSFGTMYIHTTRDADSVP